MTDPQIPDPLAVEQGLVPDTVAPPLTPPVEATADAAAAAAADVASPADPAVSRRHRARVKVAGFLHWFVLRLLAVLLFVGGVALGYNAFLNSQPAPISAVDPAVADTSPPPVVQEFIAALQSNDEAGLRSAVPPDPYQLLIAETKRWQFQTINDVKVLSTAVDGPRTATELILTGVSTAGNRVIINLVVHTTDGRISSFR